MVQNYPVHAQLSPAILFRIDIKYPCSLPSFSTGSAFVQNMLFLLILSKGCKQGYPSLLCQPMSIFAKPGNPLLVTNVICEQPPK